MKFGQFELITMTSARGPTVPAQGLVKESRGRGDGREGEADRQTETERRKG